MAKINFTKEHYDKLRNLATEMLFKNDVVHTRIGTPLTIVELLHTTNIESLNGIKYGLTEYIKRLEEADEWVAENPVQEKLEKLKNARELVNLIVGWKRYNLEKDANEKMKEQLHKQLAELKESQMTPDEKINKVVAQLKELEGTEEF